MVFWTGHRISNFFSNHTRGRFYHAAQRRGKLRDCTGECGGKRSATPLWLVFVPYPSQDEPLKPKRRRASLAAALHSPTPAGEVQSFKLAVRDAGTPEAPYTLPRLPPALSLR